MFFSQININIISIPPLSDTQSRAISSAWGPYYYVRNLGGDRILRLMAVTRRPVSQFEFNLDTNVLTVATFASDVTLLL